MNQMFYGTGPSAWLITLFGIKVIISIVGSTLNGTLAYVILRTNLIICAIGPKIDASLVNYLILGMNFGSICAYLAVWIRIKFAVGNFTDYQTHLLKCLFVLLLLELFGWTFSVGLRVLIGPLFGIVSGTFLNFLIINLATNIAYIAIDLNLPVLYTFSKEHRTALNKQWVKIKAILRLSTVHATGQQPTNAVFVVPNAIFRQQISSQSLKIYGRVYSKAM
uniref:Uncharacterized protein n=1 Tax=Meloidogyne javanica TaxID=6303 RepID=A0A915M734_MELJA